MSVQGCKCKKSKCLKMYCECFAAGLLCNEGCRCVECSNDSGHLEVRKQAIQDTLRKNPKAFEPKIAHDGDSNKNGAKHNRGCRCKKSNCLKRYCECFQASVKCSGVCRCSDCHNQPTDSGSRPTPKTPERKVKSKARHAAPSWENSPGSPLPTLSPGDSLFSPGAMGSEFGMGAQTRSTFSMEPDIFNDLTEVGNDLLLQQPHVTSAPPPHTLTPTRFASTMGLESPMPMFGSLGGTPQRGTPQWKMKDSPAKNTRSQTPNKKDTKTKPQTPHAKQDMSDWAFQLSPGLNLDTCHFLASPNNPNKSSPFFNLSPALGRSLGGRRRLTPLKRKLEDNGMAPTAMGLEGEGPMEGNTPDVMPPSFGVDTVKREPPVQSLWSRLNDLVQMRLEEGPCLAQLAQKTACLGDFEEIKNGKMTSKGLVALSEVIWGQQELQQALGDVETPSSQAALREKILHWSGMPTGSSKENVARHYILLWERLKAHPNFGAIHQVLGACPDVTPDTLATFLTTPYKATFLSIQSKRSVR